MPPKHITEKFVSTGLVCPPGKEKIEYTDFDRTGLYIEVRSTSEGQGTFWWRFKHPETGKTAREKIGRTCDISVKQAKDRVKTLRAKMALGEDITAIRTKKRTICWPELFQDHYLPYKKSHGKKSLKYDIEMNVRISARFKDTPLNKLSAVSVREFHAELRDSGLSPATADHYLKLMRHALNLAMDWDLVKSNPAAKVKLFNQTRKITRALDEEELARLMKVLTTHKNRMACHFFMLSLALGTRKGELLLAEWKHVNRSKKTLFIPGGNAKSSRDRHVFLSDFALHVLDQLGTKGKYPYLFVSKRTGKRLTTVSKQWEQIRVLAGIEDCRVHDLRRTHATLLGEAGVNAMLIKDALGHSSVTTTQIYVSPHDEARSRAANIAGEQLTTALQSAG